MEETMIKNSHFSVVNLATGEVYFTGNLQAASIIQRQKSLPSRDEIRIIYDSEAIPTPQNPYQREVVEINLDE